MNWSRRQLILAGLSLLAGGCIKSSSRDRLSAGDTPLPDPHWPYTSPVTGSPTTRRAPRPAPARRPDLPSTDALGAIPRRRWTRSGPIRGRVNPMRSVRRITVHHEGHTPVLFTDTRSTAARLEQIRSGHTGDRGWGDIGYHYIIDRAGRLWEGRDVRYQGAHVSNHNEHNLGVMLLGNFERQRPSDAQLQALHATLRKLVARYRVPTRHVYTHRELTPTACPGRYLQPRVAALRTSGGLA